MSIEPNNICTTTHNPISNRKGLTKLKNKVHPERYHTDYPETDQTVKPEQPNVLNSDTPRRSGLWRNCSTVTIVDAIMGTGKTKWITLKIKANPEEKYIVVLPYLDELKRYQKDLQGVNNLVSLHEGNHKKLRFDDVLETASIILITHQLFEKYLNDHSFNEIMRNSWNLIMDEVIRAYETVKLDHTSICGLISRKIITPKSITNELELLEVDEGKARSCIRESDYIIKPAARFFLEEAIAKDAFSIKYNNGNNNRYYFISLKKKRLISFKTITVLTYLFKNTDFYYWLKVQKININHQELVRVSNTNSLSDFNLNPHSGHYSGSLFKHLVEFLDTKPNPRKKKYGSNFYDFSSTSMKEEFNPKVKNKYASGCQKEVRNDLTNIFRNKRKGVVDPNDFIFTCRKESIPVFQDSKNRLTEEFIGEETTFLAFNTRATNNFAQRHYLAYIYNAFPFPPIQHAVKINGFNYDDERYSISVLLQWIWRSAIRRGEKIYLYLPSRRMRNLLEGWLNA